MQSEQLREPERKPPVSDFFRSLRVHFGGHRARAETRTVAGGCLPGRTRGGGVCGPMQVSPIVLQPWPQGHGLWYLPASPSQQRIRSLHSHQGADHEDSLLLSLHFNWKHHWGKGQESCPQIHSGWFQHGQRLLSIENTVAECNFPNFSRFSVYPTSL